MSTSRDLSFLADHPDTHHLINFISLAPFGIQIYDRDGASLYMNEAGEKIYGSIPPPGYNVLKDEIAIAAGYGEMLKKCFLQGVPGKAEPFWYDPGELKHVKAPPKRTAVQTHHIPVKDKSGKVIYVIFIHMDVTAQIFMEQEKTLAFKERDDARVLIQNVLDQTQAVVFIKDLSGKYLFINSQYRQIFNLTEGQILGRRDHDIFAKEFADRWAENDRYVAEKQRPIEAEETAAHADGAVHTYLSLKFPLRDSTGEVFAVCGVSTDITKFKKAEQEMHEAKRVQSIGLMASGIAHNFNNLLSIIMLTADTLLLKKGVGETDWRSAMKSIKDTAYNASFLSRQLLSFGRQHTAAPSLIELRSTLSGIKEILTNVVGDDVRLKFDIADDVWPIYADPTQVEQIIINLCLNARDAVRKAGQIDVAVKNITLKAASQRQFRIGKPIGDYVEIAIRDNGVGMSPEILGRLFQPFFTTKAHGTGLGLSTVFDIVKGAGGEIFVESELFAGSSFYVYLPRTKQMPAREGVGAKNTGKAVTGGSILLVEDEDILRHLTANLLRQHGYEVIEAKNGRVGLELWPVIAKTVDLVLADVIMPEMNGPEMVKKMIDSSASRPKVLYMSAYSDEKLSSLDMRQNPQILQKPFSAHQLIRKVQETLV